MTLKKKLWGDCYLFFQLYYSSFFQFPDVTNLSAPESHTGDRYFTLPFQETTDSTSGFRPLNRIRQVT